MYKIFISYTWENKEWVKKLADDLEAYDEFHIILDQYDLDNSIDKNHFMEKGIFESDLILVICTKEYAYKANNRLGGVGIETFMSTIRHWEEMENKQTSNIFALMREDRLYSTPNYLKGKISISFQDDNQYNKSLSFLIKNIQEKMSQTSTRPQKTKSLKNAPVNYFQFDRVEDILAIIAKKREKLDGVTDFKDKNRIKYEYWKTTSFNSNSFILVLFNNITIRDTIERFIRINKHRITRNLVILRTSQGEKDYIDKIFKSHDINVNIAEFTIEQFIWDECIDQEWKNENKIIEEEFFIDQRLYQEDEEGNKKTLKLSIPLIKDTFLFDDSTHSILMLFAAGGMGKSTLSQVLTNEINDRKDKKALLIQSDIIRNHIKKDAIRNFEIKSLYELYDIYEKILSANKSLLTQKQFELGIISGKIIVIIDGLDEIITLFHENFNVKEFLNSLYELNMQLGKTKIMITSRLNILENHAYLKENEETEIFYLKGFEEDIWNKYIEKRFLKYVNSDLYLKKINKYITSLLNISNDSEKILLPFFLDLISEIVEEELKNEQNSFIIDSINSDYPSNCESIDYLIHAILKREIKRQQFNMSVTKFVAFFKDLVMSYGDKLSFANLKDLIEISFDSNDTHEIYSKILLNPLVKVNTSLEVLYFKYDFLGNYFKTLAIIDYFSNNEIKVLDKQIVNDLSKYYDGSHIVLNECIKYFSKNIPLCIQNSKSIINLIIQQINQENKNHLKLKHTISTLLYFTQKIHGSILSKDKRIEIVKSLYSNNEIKHFYIWGEFYPLDFSNIKVWSSEFHEYTSFSKCKFENTIFYHSLFEDIEIHNCSISKENFDLDSCSLGTIQQYIDNQNSSFQNKIKVFEEDFLKFCRNFFNGSSFEAKLLENITIPPRFQNKKHNILDFLISNTFLIQDSLILKKYYEIDKQYHRSIKSLIENNHIDPKIQDILISYIKKI